jgi:predicted secreted protein
VQGGEVTTVRKAILAAAACLFLVPAAAPAGDTSHYSFLGFSTDLVSCAFEIHGVLDGSGFPYSTVYIITVDANDYAARPFSSVGENAESEEEVQAATASSSSGMREKLGIDPSNIGLSVEAAEAEPLRLDLAGAGASGSLRLAERPTGRATPIGNPEVMFELDLLVGGRKVILQKDAALPRGRSGTYSYSIKKAFINGRKIAAFLEYARAGFEGPDVRQMIVTGVIPR